jgi:hypothetical protein
VIGVAVVQKKQCIKNNNSFQIRWVRYARTEYAKLEPSFKKATCFAGSGGRGSGKSSLLEIIAEHFDQVIDLYGSRDNEGLAWLRHPKYKDSALLLKGGSVELDCHCAEVMNAVDFKLADLERFKMVISFASAYHSVDEEWSCLPKIIDMLGKRTHWEKPTCLIVREASSLLYSRMAIGESEQNAKAHFIHMMREMRHSGFALAMDTIRWLGIDTEARNCADFMFFKAQGIEGLPKQLRFLYRGFKPSGVQLMKKNTFIIVSKEGAIGFGRFRYPFWHKEEREDMLRLFDIRPSYKDLPFTGEQGKVGDYEHVRIIKVRLETGMGMGKVAKMIDRSSKTVFDHINAHNNMVHSVGECDKCARVGSKLAKVPIDTGE